MDKRQHASALLRWYDEHARVLPWRMGPGCTGWDSSGAMRAAPYHVWLSEIMLQQTVVKTVIPYFETFLTKWPTLFDLAACDLEDVLKRWAGLGYYARARNLHACAKVVASEYGGVFPSEEKHLLALPGIGPYTQAAIRAIAFGQRAGVVDGNVERVLARLYALQQPVREIKADIKDKAFALTPTKRPGDYAQAMMDLGATICTPKRPACGRCPLQKNCKAFKLDCAAALPVRAAKKAKPIRTGTAFLVVREDGCVLLRQRPDKGLLAKMLEVPSIGWIEDKYTEQSERAPLETQWQQVPGIVTHTFTHFHLQLDVRLAHVAVDQLLLAGADHRCFRWVLRKELSAQALPGVMRKILSHGLGEPL